jgi:predicted ester cyclase
MTTLAHTHFSSMILTELGRWPIFAIAQGRYRHTARMALPQHKEIVTDSFLIIERGDVALAERIIHPDFTNHEADDDPEDIARGLRGSAGFLATARWLQSAFSDIHWEHRNLIAEDENVVVITTMFGIHHGAFQDVAATGRQIKQRQIHLFRLRDSLIIEHLAQRDDLGLLLQIGWKSPASRIQ